MSKKKKKRVVLSGYFGFGNCGDEGVLMAMLKALQALDPDLSMTVLSGDPKQTKSNFGVNAVSRWKLGAIARKLFLADLFISGGGSLLQDVTSAKSPLYYLGILALARRLSKRTMVYAQGIGPLTIEKNRRRTVKILERCDLITLRDQASADELAAMGLQKPMTVTADPVLALDSADAPEEPGCRLLQELGLMDDQKKKKRPLLLAALRSWPPDDYFEKIGEALDAKAAEGWDILLVPMHFPGDMQAIQQVSNHMKSRTYCLGQPVTPQAFFSLVRQADLMLAMRLHGLIFAMAAGVPMAALSYDPKVDRFMEQTGLDACFPLADFSAGELIGALDRLSRRTPDMLEEQEKHRQWLHSRAWETARMAIGLLDS